MLTAEQRDILQTIDAYGAALFLVPPVIVAATVGYESDFQWAPDPGDGGLSYGPVQVYTGDDAGPRNKDRAHWEGPDGLRNAALLMRSQWQDTFERHGGLVAFAADPRTFLWRYLPDAQGSKTPGVVAIARAMRGVAAWREYEASKGATKPMGGTHPSPLYGRKGYWLRQFGDTSERTLSTILDTLTGLGGGDCLCLKVADGMTWQGIIDGNTPVQSVEDILVLKQQCEARGVGFLPVVVPRGRDIAGEARLHAGIAASVGSLMTDIEPYEGFWDQAPHARIPEYTAALRAGAPGAYLINQPDPREGAIRDARVAETAAHFNGISAQHYVGWASVGWTDVDAEIHRFDALADLGRDMYVTLYGKEHIDLAGAFWGLLHQQALGVHVFAFGAMDARELQWFAGLPRPAVPGPAPKPTPDPVTIEGVKLGMIQKILAEDWAALYADAAKLVGAA